MFKKLIPDTKILPNELLVGLTLAIVVLPQAIAFSTTLAGVPPYFGIYAAIWGVLFTALLNPSSVFHGGPNSTLSAVVGVTLLPIAPQFGVSYMGYALTLILMAGLVQLLFYFIKPLARLLDLMSEAVINGMIAGIGLFLILKSITAFGGLPINTEVEWPLAIAWHNILAVLEIGNMHAIGIGMVTLVSAIIVRSIKPVRNWGILVGIIVGTIYSEYLGNLYGLVGVPGKSIWPGKYPGRTNCRFFRHWFCVSFNALVYPGSLTRHYRHHARCRYPGHVGTFSNRGRHAQDESKNRPACGKHGWHRH